MQEVKVAVHHQAGSDRIHEFQDTREEENESADESAESSGLEKQVFEEIICRHIRQLFSES